MQVLDRGVVAGADQLHDSEGQAEGCQQYGEGAENKIERHTLADLVEGLGTLRPALGGHRSLQRARGQTRCSQKPRS